MSIIVLSSKHKLSLILNSCFLILLSLGLTAIFWLPALLETKFVQGLQIYNINQNFADIFELLFPSWGTGFFDGDLSNQMSVQIGVANLFSVGLGIFFLRRFWKEKKWVIFFSYIWFAVLFFLMLPFSQSLWATIPLIHYFQFPWRLLSLEILVCSLIAGSLVRRKWSALLLSAFVIVTTISYAHPVFYHLRNDTYYTSRSNFIDGTNSPGNSFNTIWAPTPTQHAKEIFFIQHGQGSVVIHKNSPTSYQLSITAQTAVTIQANISYFPGWAAKEGNHTIPLIQQNGLTKFGVTKGKHTIAFALALTFIQKLASILSLLSLITFVVIGIAYVRKFFLSRNT